MMYASVYDAKRTRIMKIENEKVKIKRETILYIQF